MRITLILITALFVTPIFAKITLPNSFSSNMVIQRDAAFHIYGFSSNEETVSVSFKNQTQIAIPQNGKWSVTFEAEKAGGPYAMEINGENSIVLSDIYFGDVFFCSGGDFMNIKLKAFQDSIAIDKDSKYPQIRYLKIKNDLANKPQDELLTPSKWQIYNKTNARNFSAIGSVIAKILHNRLQVPIGIIDNSWNNTDIASLMSKNCFVDKREVLQKIKLLKEANNLSENFLTDFDFTLDEFGDTLDIKAIKWHNHFPTAKYNAIVYPMHQHKLKGVLWIQDDEDVLNQRDNHWMFIRLINDYRNKWSQANLPFIYAQLPAVINSSMTDEEVASFRKSQKEALVLTNTAMVNTLDLISSDNNHTLDLKSIAQRFIYPIENLCYQANIDYVGPSPIIIERNDKGYLITFNHTDKTLMAINGEEIKGFLVPHPNEGFIKTTGKIIAPNKVQVMSPYPISGMVRYLWSSNPGLIYLYNSLGNPAPPFEWFVD